MAKEKKRGLAAVEKIGIRVIDPLTRIFTAQRPSGRADLVPQKMQTSGLPASHVQT
jgi:hypothetical protein